MKVIIGTFKNLKRKYYEQKIWYVDEVPKKLLKQ